MGLLCVTYDLLYLYHEIKFQKYNLRCEYINAVLSHHCWPLEMNMDGHQLVIEVVGDAIC